MHDVHSLPEHANGARAFQCRTPRAAAVARKTLLSGATTWSARAGAIAPSAHKASDKPMRPSEQRLMG
jgi:hypothetical protein